MSAAVCTICDQPAEGACPGGPPMCAKHACCEDWRLYAPAAPAPVEAPAKLTPAEAFAEAIGGRRRERVEAPKAASGGLWRYHGHGGKYRITRAKDGSTPEWPAFVLAASDPAAPAALRQYAVEAEVLGMDRQYVGDVIRLAVEFEGWRREHGAGKPDALPEVVATVEAPGGQPEGTWREAERGANEGAAERAFEGLLQRLGNDLVDAQGDELPVAVHTVAEEATRVAYTLGAAHARQGTPAEEAERAKVLQEARAQGYDEGFASGREQGQRDERARIVALLADLRDDLRRRAIGTRAEGNRYKRLAREARQVEQSYLSAAGGLVEAATRLGDGEAQ